MVQTESLEKRGDITMDGNNMNPMGPDPNMFGGQQPQQFGQPQGGQNPYGQPQQGQNPYGQPQQYGQPQAPQGGQYGQSQQGQNPYGQPQQYGQPQAPQGGQYGQPQAPQGGQYGQPQAPQGGQNPYGQQGGQFGQPQAPQGGQNPYGQQGGQYGGQPSAQPGMVYNDTSASNAYTQPQPGFGGPGSGGSKPPKSGGGNKTGLIIGIAAGAVVLIGIIVAAILILGGKNIKGAEQASLGFVQAYSELDFEKMLEYVPEEIASSDDYEFNEEDSEEMAELLESFGFELKDPEIVESERLDPKATAKEMNDKFDTEFKFKNAARVVIDATMSITFFDETSEDDVEFEFTCGKIGGKWYIIDLEDNSDEVFEEEEEDLEGDIDTDDNDDDDDDLETATIDEDEEGDPSANGEDDSDSEDGEYEDISSIAEIIDMSTAPSHVVDAPAGVSDDYKDMCFSFEGTVYTMPFSLKELSSDWVLNESYFYKEDEELEPGDDSSSNQHENENYDEWFDLYLATCNPTEETIAYEDSYVKEFDADIDYCDTDNYPELILSKGITWGSSLQDIYDAYGDANSVYMGYDNSYVYLYYYIDEYGFDELTLEVSFEKGLTRVEYSNWNWDK